MIRGKRLKILCVDEDDFLLHMEERMLKRVCPNAQVSLAIGPEDAQRFLQEETFHIMFIEPNSKRFSIDSLLNPQTGFKKFAPVKVGLSGYSLPEKIRSSIDFFLEKPFSLNDLERLFDRAEFHQRIYEMDF